MEISLQNTDQNKELFIFVGGLPLSASAKNIGEYFEQFGLIQKVDIPLNKIGLRKGFAFVHFNSLNTVSKVLSHKSHCIQGKRIAVRSGMVRSDASSATRSMQYRKLFASGFPSHTNEIEVFNLISRYGKIERILCPKGGIGERGFCYIVMKEKLAYKHLCQIEQINFESHLIKITPAQLKGQIKETQTKSTGVSYNSESGNSQWLVDRNQEKGSFRTIAVNNHRCAIGSHQSERTNSMDNSKSGLYSPFIGIPTISFRQFSNRLLSKKPVAPICRWKTFHPAALTRFYVVLHPVKPPDPTQIGREVERHNAAMVLQMQSIPANSGQDRAQP